MNGNMHLLHLYFLVVGRGKPPFNSRINTEITEKVATEALADKISTNMHVRDKGRKAIIGSNP